MATPRTTRGDTARAGLYLLCLLTCVFLCASVWGYDPSDWPSTTIFPHNVLTRNACGRVGAWAAHQLFYYIGPGTYALLAGLTAMTGAWLIRGRVGQFWQRAFGICLVVVSTAATGYLVGGSKSGRLPIESGGIVGVGLGRFLQLNFHWAGSALILLYGLVVGLLFAADGLVNRFPGLVRQKSGGVASAVGGAGKMLLDETWRSLRSVVASRGRGGQSEPQINRSSPPAKRRPADSASEKPARGSRASFEEERPEGDAATEANTSGAGAQDTAADSGLSKPTVRVNQMAEPSGETGTPDLPAMTRPYPTELPDWEFPPLRLLDEPEYTYSLEQENKVREKAAVLEQTLEEYRVDAQVVEIDTGPVITMYELRVGPGVKVSQIASLVNDIARALRAPAVRVVAPIPGKNTIGIEVPNVDKEKVRLRELIELVGRKRDDMILPLYLGKDASGNPLVGELAKMPHLLVAGTTGSGKSVCINSVIASILMTQRPDMVKLILVDPKMVELSIFRDIPHLMCPIVTEISKAQSILEWAVTKMEERYSLLAEAGVRNIAAFNRMSKEEIYGRFEPQSDEEKVRVPTHLPYVIIIVDELADLMMTAGKEVEHCLARLAQKSRAVGIHIILATQRPEARIVTGLIKSNMPCRIAFRVSSRMDSRIVLDQNGGEVLMGQGDMLFLPPGQSKLVRAQGTMVEDRELHKLLEFVRQRGKPDYHPELVRMQNADGVSAGERDELFDDAVQIVLESQRGSVSLLQRRLTIGYSRASRLIDQMAYAGIVGEYKGSQAREVLITAEEWGAIRVRRDAEEEREAEYEATDASDEPEDGQTAADSDLVDDADGADEGEAADEDGEWEEEEEGEEGEDGEWEENDEEDEDAGESTEGQPVPARGA